jgi:hypothetical protein
MSSQANGLDGPRVYRMSPDRVRATTTALAILAAIVIAIGLLIVALIGVVAGTRFSSGTILTTLVLMLVVAIALGTAALVLRRQVRSVAIRTSAAGIEYESSSALIRAPWSACVRVCIVPIGLGFGEGILLSEPGLVRARFPQALRAQRLDRVIPLSNVMWWWRDTALADDLARWAPQLGVGPGASRSA